MGEISRKLRALDERAGAHRSGDRRTIVWMFAATSAALLVAALVVFLVSSNRLANLFLVAGALMAFNAAIHYGAYRVRGK